MRVDLQRYFGIEIQRRPQRNGTQGRAEAGVAITAAKAMLDFGQVKPRAQPPIARILPQGVFIVGQRFAPALLPFKLATLVQQYLERVERLGGKPNLRFAGR